MFVCSYTFLGVGICLMFSVPLIRDQKTSEIVLAIGLSLQIIFAIILACIGIVVKFNDSSFTSQSNINERFTINRLESGGEIRFT